jgi:hypothetical protein
MIGANGKNMIEDPTPRNKAIWKSALDQLVDFGLLAPVGHQGTNFDVTKKGYEVADLIKSRAE